MMHGKKRLSLHLLTHASMNPAMCLRRTLLSSFFPLFYVSIHRFLKGKRNLKTPLALMSFTPVPQSTSHLPGTESVPFWSTACHPSWPLVEVLAIPQGACYLSAATRNNARCLYFWFEHRCCRLLHILQLAARALEYPAFSPCSSGMHSVISSPLDAIFIS